MEEGGADCNPPLFLILRGSHPCVWSQRREKRRMEDEDDGGAPLFNVKGGPSLSPPPLFFSLPFSLQRGRGEIGRSPRMEMGREGGRRRNSRGGRRRVPFSSHFLAVFLCHRRRRRCCGHRQSLSLTPRDVAGESLLSCSIRRLWPPSRSPSPPSSPPPPHPSSKSKTMGAFSPYFLPLSRLRGRHPHPPPPAGGFGKMRQVSLGGREIHLSFSSSLFAFLFPPASSSFLSTKRTGGRVEMSNPSFRPPIPRRSRTPPPRLTYLLLRFQLEHPPSPLSL